MSLCAKHHAEYTKWLDAQFKGNSVDLMLEQINGVAQSCKAGRKCSTQPGDAFSPRATVCPDCQNSDFDSDGTCIPCCEDAWERYANND